MAGSASTSMLILIAVMVVPVLASALEVVTAHSPYRPVVGESGQFIELNGKPRVFDFGGDAPFVNPMTGVADFATINVWNPKAAQASVLSSAQILVDGIPGRVFKVGGYTALGYVSGDGLVEGALRTQLNSFPFSARRYYVWELTFRLGGRGLTAPWAFTDRGVAPATIWQLKTTNLPPSLVMAVDTDPSDNSKVALNFDIRLDPARPAVRIADIGGLDPSADTQIRIEAFLDERPASSGDGFLRLWVNGRQLIDRRGPVLQLQATFPYHWSLAMYLYNCAAPLHLDRFVYWRTARMLSEN